MHNTPELKKCNMRDKTIKYTIDRKLLLRKEPKEAKTAAKYINKNKHDKNTLAMIMEEFSVFCIKHADLQWCSIDTRTTFNIYSDSRLLDRSNKNKKNN